MRGWFLELRDKRALKVVKKAYVGPSATHTMGVDRELAALDPRDATVREAREQAHFLIERSSLESLMPVNGA